MKTVLITGCATGLGYETAKYLCNKGFHVYATMRECEGRNSEQANALKTFAESQSGNIDIVELDVTNEEHMMSVANKFAESGLDCLVNNAGLGALGFIESFSLEQVRRVFEVNVFGPFALTKRLLPALEKSKGLVVNVSSAGGRVCFPFLGVYNASKYALEALEESWNHDNSVLGNEVDVCLIEPGAYPTELDNKKLEPADIKAFKEKYGELADAPQKMVEEGMKAVFEQLDSVPEPGEIAEAIENLIKAPAGSRPLRQVVGIVATDGIREYNEAYKETYARLFGQS